MRMPRRRPETTIERAVARRFAGARSPTRGSTGNLSIKLSQNEAPSGRFT